MAERRRGAGAIEDFDYARFGGPTTYKESQVNVGLTSDRIIGNNPDRVHLLITNNGPDALTWATKNMAAAGTRNLLGNGQTLVFQVQNDAALTGAELFGVAPVVGCALNIVEIIRVHADR